MKITVADLVQWIFTILQVTGYQGDEHLEHFAADEEDCKNLDSPELPEIRIPWNTPFRAYKTLPKGIYLADSNIPNSGLGVFSETFIKRYTWLGEYEGESVLTAEHISSYAWIVYRSGLEYYYIDGYHIPTSNWLRWLNCPRHRREENVEVHECRGKIYYVTCQDIYPGEELLIYYGDGYAAELDIDVDKYYDDADNDTVVSNCDKMGNTGDSCET